MTITEFLLARITEDEASAGTVYEVWNFAREEVSPLRARVLAECEAKRRIVETLTHIASQQPADEWSPSDSALVDVVATMAAVYADHPDYNDEWR